MRISTLALMFFAAVACAKKSQSTWHDPSPHSSQFVEVQQGVHLEVLDWGGTGRPIILLPGSGNTAHIYDDFAPKLVGIGHVYGITRRGFGASSHPDTGYTDERLAADVLSVMQQLKITKPVLVGHSMSGEELTRIGNEHSDLLSGLVYLAAGADPTDFPSKDKQYMELAHKLPAAMQPGPPPSATDRSSVQAASDWLESRVHVRFPLGEVYASNIITPEGRVEDFPDETRIHTLIGEGAHKPDYSRISVPILDFVDADCPVKPRADIDCLRNSNPDYVAKNDAERQAIDNFWAATDVYIYRWMDEIRAAQRPVRFIDIPRANHYVFLSNTTDVIRELETFLKTLSAY
jgi:non-heme chloroperoxidase